MAVQVEGKTRPGVVGLKKEVIITEVNVAVQPDHGAVSPLRIFTQNIFDVIAAPVAAGVRPGDSIASHFCDLRLAGIRIAAALQAEFITYIVSSVPVISHEHLRRVNTLHIGLISRSDNVRSTPGRTVSAAGGVSELPHLHLLVILRQRTSHQRHRDHIPRRQTNVRRRVRIIPRANNGQGIKIQTTGVVNTHHQFFKLAAVHVGSTAVIDARADAIAREFAAVNIQSTGSVVDTLLQISKIAAVHIGSSLINDSRALTKAREFAAINIQRTEFIN